jgi:hypothetical protein
MTGVGCIMAGMGGPRDVLALIGAFEFAFQIDPATAGAGYQLTSGGKEQSGTGSSGGVIYTNIGDWVLPNGNASLYEVRATLTSGALSSGTTGSWLALSTTRTWEVSRASLGMSNANLTIEIRLTGGSGTILASTLVGLTAEVSL